MVGRGRKIGPRLGITVDSNFDEPFCLDDFVTDLLLEDRGQYHRRNAGILELADIVDVHRQRRSRRD
jgi:hypothetical protein